MENIKLSDNFSLSEFTKSDTAIRHGINNWPEDEEIVENLEALCEAILQPVREHFDVPVRVNSGYRCLELNRLVKSKDTSQHTKGEAADIEINDFPNLKLAQWIRDNLEFDQLILEFYDPENGPNSGWVHVSYTESRENRNQTLTINKKGVFNGFVGE